MNKNNKQWIYEFSSDEIIKKEDGSQEIKSHKFTILKPNRKMKEDGELFFASETSRFAKAGVLPRAAWNTILSNGGGSISDKERELYGDLLIKFRDLSFELQSILLKTESEKTEAEKLKSNELIKELDNIRKEIQSFESSQIEIFENTAEAKARNRTILWWVLNLAYEIKGDSIESILTGESFQERLDTYDALYENETENEFILSMIKRFTYLITIWYLGRATSTEDFSLFDKSFVKDAQQEGSEIEP
jgi:hypothetical protein